MNKFENTNNYTIQNIEDINIDMYNPNFNVAILDCGVIKECQRQRATKIQKILKSYQAKSEIISVIHNDNLKQEINSDNLKEFTHIIITGSNLDYDSQLEEIKYLKQIIKNIRSLNIPTLGICFGAQVIASVFGGTIQKQKNKEIGFSEISILKEHQIFENLEKELNVFESHLDHLKSLPDGAIQLAKSDLCHQAYIYQNFIGIQFHPEIDLEFAKYEFQAIKNCPINKYCEIEFFKNYNKEHKPEIIFKNFLFINILNNKIIKNIY
jgi:GMP synthase-like glutamine amidotransferase